MIKLRVNTETQAVMNVTFLTAPAVSYLAGIFFNDKSARKLLSEIQEISLIFLNLTC